jgi:hypothetical protein
MSDNTTFNIKYGDIDLLKPHFSISYSAKEGDNWQQIALLNAPDTDKFKDIKLKCLHLKTEEIMDLLLNELKFYLVDKCEKHPIAYLFHHVTTLANAYSKIHFSYIESINSNNIFYYMKTKFKQDNFNISVKMDEYLIRYTDYRIKHIFDNAFDKQSAVDIYNTDLNYLYKLIFNTIPEKDGFTIVKPTIVEFGKMLIELNSIDFLYAIAYLDFRSVINESGAIRLLKFIANQNINKQD